MHKLLAMTVLLAMAGTATAADPACKTNFKQEGKYFTGRSFTTWDVVPGVSVSTAFKRIYTEGTKSGLRVASSDEKVGVISFEQPNGGVDLGGDKATLPWNVVIEAQGKKDVKITVTKTTPGGYATSQDFQITSMCAVIDAAR
ncbi:MAG: hypothetical protein ABL934_18545 [Lysobacteraceae bacterium]